MIIDNGIYTISARAQDLEVALLAAREVVDDDNDDNDNEEIEEEDKHKNKPVHHIKAYPEGNETNRDMKTTRETTPSILSSSSSSSSSEQTLSDNISSINTCKGNPQPNDISIHSKSERNIMEDVSMDETLVDDADFHRVFTTAGGRARSILQPQQWRSGGKLMPTTIDSRLERLRGMLSKMHHPHYTLSTVFHGRKLFVAVIPEHEVAKRREMQRKGR
ncbi:uncharacterized protein TM35_000063540 [Trypanosoma theileri]|uniref:Uncharacterized protein n=1 Tax=Trypanosoma theileri TaxID=67003 RepID=A0A1X0P457_9TRYP|nr:uncharacterized protein TM35_000063540 [Trypanosoma theileri]ORC91349.1 hypothetical protein TM35_000063540 [Trypanosoma theileri]